MDALSDPDTLFVSSNPERGPVTRFSIPARVGTSEYIGAHRDPNDPRRLLFNSDAVIAIAGAEVRRFRREYFRALERQELLPRTREEYEAWTLSETRREADEALERKTAKAAALAAPAASGGSASGAPAARTHQDEEHEFLASPVRGPHSPRKF